EHEVELSPGPAREVVFQVTPGPQGGQVQAQFQDGDGKTHTRGQVVLDYEHIPIQTVFPAASARLVRLDLARVGDSVGYIMGPGDEVPDALEQAGYRVTLLTDADLNAGNLDGYDAIVVGVRAYNSREPLKRNASRLLDYVARGGTVVVQYNT